MPLPGFSHSDCNIFMYQFFIKFPEYLGSCFKNEHNLNWFMWIVFYKVFCKLYLLQSTTSLIWAIPDKTGLIGFSIQVWFITSSV